MNRIKTAVLLYGFLRTYKQTSESLIKNVLEVNDADLFICCYDNTGLSSVSSQQDINDYKRKQATIDDQLGDFINEKDLYSVYGHYLKDAIIKKYDPEYYKNACKDCFAIDVPLFRFFSLYDNISKSCGLLNKYVKQKHKKYDAVVLVRPDLNFYSKIDVQQFDLRKLNIPNYGGNIQFNKVNDLYYVTSYRNILRNEYIPWHDVPFSDQLIISSYENMKCLESLYSNLKTYDSYGIPVCHPETCVYYHLGYKQNLEVKTNRILYEILRNGESAIDNGFIHSQKQQKIQPSKSKLWKYKILRKLCWGNLRRKYQEKYNALKK